MIFFRQALNRGDSVEHAVSRVVARGRTPFQEYLFFESPVHGLCIALDGDIQSCEADEAVYHEALVHPAMLLHPDPRRVLIMGGGEGATAREILRHGCVEQVVMVDIDEAFVALCREHAPGWSAGAFDDPRLELRHEDIRTYLANPGTTFDVIIGDLVDFTDLASPVAALYSHDFYRAVLAAAADDAVLATQGGSLTMNHLDGHVRIRRGLAADFAEVLTCGVVVPSFHTLWGFVLAARQSLDADTRPLPEIFAARAAERGLGEMAVGPRALAAGFELPDWLRRELDNTSERSP